MALDDVYQLKVKQDSNGQTFENLFFFERLDPAGTASDLIDGFVADYVPEMRALQSQSTFVRTIECLNLGDLGDFDNEVLNLAGLAGSGDTLPVFNAVGYSLRLNTRAVKPGSKRISGILEAVVLNGRVTDPTYLAAMEAFRIKLDDEVTGALANYQPVVVKRIKTPIVGTVPQKYKYLLPTVGDPLVLGLVVQALFNQDITSQVSRKN